MGHGTAIKSRKGLAFIITIKIIQEHSKGERADMEFITTTMVIFMKENGIMILEVEEVDLLMLMEIFIKGNGSIIKNMVLENIQTLMDLFTMEVFIMVTKKENVKYYFKMVEDCKAIGIK